MRLDGSIDTKTLTALGVEALHLLCNGNITALADRFGYALAYGRAPATVIGDDLRCCLVELGARSLEPPLDPAPKVEYFRPNDTGLLAVVTSLARTDNGTAVLLQLIVAGADAEKHVTLEGIDTVWA